MANTELRKRLTKCANAMTKICECTQGVAQVLQSEIDALGYGPDDAPTTEARVLVGELHATRMVVILAAQRAIRAADSIAHIANNVESEGSSTERS